MSTDRDTTTPWVKATASDTGNSCIQMRRHDGLIEVRDSKQSGRGPILTLTAKEFAAWLHGAAEGEFSHLLD